MPQNVIGVDVAKAWIDVHSLASRKDRRIKMTAQALRAFARTIDGALVVFEASGGYERPLAEALDADGVAYARVNPRQAREFARAIGRLSKTDKVDARVLAAMGKALDLRPTPSIDPARRRLAELVARRDDLVESVTRESQRLARAGDAFIRKDIKGLLASLKRRKRAVDQEIAQQLKDHSELQGLDRRLRTVPGVGPTIAPVLIARLPELGTLNRRAIASLAGLAPHACDSGQRTGKRRIWGGRADVRRVLYLAAFIASRRDPELRAYRQRLQAAGKSFKAAIIATARKLLTHLNAIVKDGRNYEIRSPA